MSLTAELVTLTDTSEGFATILTARGPGTGINRMQVTVRNEPAIAKYGAREVVEDFPTAVDAADLLAKAQARLADVSDPAKFQQLTVRVAGHTEPFRLGQRVRVSDGELGFATTAKIVGIDANEDGSTLTLGDAPASLLDVINAKDAEERRDVALGLPAPISVQLVPAPTGLTVLVTLGANSRAVGVEVHVSPVSGFIPDVSTLAARGPGVRFEIEGLPTAIRQFVRVRAFDDRGNFSPFTDQISNAARGVGTAELVVGQIDITNAERAEAALSVKTSGGAEVLRLGNIIGKAGVPAGTQFGLWGALGSGVFIENVPRIVYADSATLVIETLITSLAAGANAGFSTSTVLKSFPVVKALPGQKVTVNVAVRQIGARWYKDPAPGESPAVVFNDYAFNTWIRHSPSGVYMTAPFTAGVNGSLFDGIRINLSGTMLAVTALTKGKLRAVVQFDYLVVVTG